MYGLHTWCISEIYMVVFVCGGRWCMYKSMGCTFFLRVSNLKKASLMSDTARIFQDELYTGYDDIAQAVRHYRKHFKNQVVLCNCDDPFESNFFKYFALNFKQLKLKKLITVSYENSPIANREISIFPPGSKYNALSYKIELTQDNYANIAAPVTPENIAAMLKNDCRAMWLWVDDGDFHTYESMKLLREADIVVTHPPCSRLAEYIKLIINYRKKFLLTGKLKAINTPEIFNCFKNQQIHLIPRKPKLTMQLTSPYLPPEDNPVKINHITWFTNL